MFSIDLTELLKSGVTAIFAGLGTGLGSSLGIYFATRYVIGNVERLKLNGNGRKKENGESH